MERIGAVQACVDKIVAAQTKEIDIKFGYVHLYSACCTTSMPTRQETGKIMPIRALPRQGRSCRS